MSFLLTKMKQNSVYLFLSFNMNVLSVLFFSSLFSMTSTAVQKVKRPAVKRSMLLATAAVLSTVSQQLITFRRCTIALGRLREPCGTPNRPNPSRQTCRQLVTWYATKTNYNIQLNERRTKHSLIQFLIV